MSGIKHNPDDLHRSGGKLQDFGQKIEQGGQKVDTAGQNLISHASGDKSGIGAALTKVLGRGMEVTGKVFKEGGRVVHGAGTRLHETGTATHETDQGNHNLLRGIHDEEHKETHTHSESTGSKGSSSSGAGGHKHVEPPKKPDSSTQTSGARGQIGDTTRQHAIPDVNKTTTKDPIDLVTGAVLLTQTDVLLPGILQLILKRTHISSYRIGRWFGHSWAATIGQRLELDSLGAVFVAEDGMVLSYPEHEELPTEGPRWSLARVAGGYTISDPQTGMVRSFSDNGTGQLPLTSIVNAAGHRIDFEYDGAGVPTFVRHSGGYVLRLDVVDERIVSVALVGDVEQVLVQFTYDDKGNLASVINSSGLPLTFEYDDRGRMTQWRDRNDMWYRYTYDESGRCVLGEGKDRLLNCEIRYDLEDRVTYETNSLGATSEYHYNELLQVVKFVDALGGTAVSEWDRYDRLLAQTDSLGRVTRYEYTELGDLTGIIFPDGSETRTEIDVDRLPVSTTDVSGLVERFEFDDARNLVARVGARGNRVEYSYSDDNNIAAVTGADGNVTRIESSGTGLSVREVSHSGEATQFVRDDHGRIIDVIDPEGGHTRFSWSVEGKVTSCSYPDGRVHRWEFDAEGLKTRFVNELGLASNMEYGGFGQLTGHVDIAGNRTDFTYDTELRLIKVSTASGLQWTRTFDKVGNLVSETDSTGRVLQYQHDAMGQTIRSINALAQETSYQYDLGGRPIRIEDGDGVRSFAYDVAGRVMQATNSSADVVITRDEYGQILSEGTNGNVVTRSYDEMGNLAQRVTPSGLRSNWQYADDNAVSGIHIGAQRISFGYDQYDREISREFGTVTLAQAYDDLDRPRVQAITVAERLAQRRSYTYRADSAVTNIVDQLAGIREFELDLLGRATKVDTGTRAETYRYDADSVVSASRNQDSYDVQGRLVERRVRTLSGRVDMWQYVWNCSDQLVEVVTPAGIRWEYSYDALGRRLSKQRLDATGSVAERTVFTWDELVLVEQEHSSGAVTSWEYEPGQFTPLAQIERVRGADQERIDREFFGIITDLVGTPQELFTLDGELAWKQDTTLWGEPVNPRRQRGYCPIRFPGQYHDSESGFYYNLHRYYNPAEGSYISPDPVGLAAGPDSRSYVTNPVRSFDPLGLYEVFWRRMGQKEWNKVSKADGKLDLKGTESFVTRSEEYVDGLHERTQKKFPGRKGESYLYKVRYEMEDGTEAALRKAGWVDKPPTSGIIEQGLDGLPNYSGNDDQVHIKEERGSITYGLMSGTVDIFNNNIRGHHGKKG